LTAGRSLAQTSGRRLPASQHPRVRFVRSDSEQFCDLGCSCGWKVSVESRRLVSQRGEELAENLMADLDCLSAVDRLFGVDFGHVGTQALAERKDAGEEGLSEDPERGVQGNQ
jgi:hypothetical protein